MATAKSKSAKISPFAALSAPAQRALASAGIGTLAQAAKRSDADLLALHGFGPKGLRMLRAMQTARPAAAAKPAPAEKIHDSPEAWIRKHIEAYVSSNGAEGHMWRGLPTLLLTTRGRKSGMLRRTALIYGQDGDRVVVVASNGGSANHPLWHLNLQQDANATVQAGERVFAARAHVAKGAERARLWKLMAKIFPTYDRYAVEAGVAKRVIPVVVLSPVV